ncbi:hypothetical protein HML84_07420 [Alcanivorax sp. IO_7]|nr:hypothetical protein HML84_07420 [Alcanivorax sp. IO_7]
MSADDNRQVRQTTLETTVAKANRILHPYTLEVKDCAWYTVYEVGHRVTDKFDDVDPGDEEQVAPRVFIAGDACHTHSAKAGQGMNVSMQDGWNIAWKLGQVLSGQAPPELLATYSEERQEVAQNLIDFDREWSSLMAKPAEDFEDPKELADFYVKTAEFPAGFMTEYRPSLVTGDTRHQSLATGFPVGKRFKSAPVMRVCDGNDVHLGHHATADGRWRIYAFADAGAERLNDWAEWMLNAAASPVARFTPDGADLDSLFDIKVIYQQPHGEVEFGPPFRRCSNPGWGPSSSPTTKRFTPSTRSATSSRPRHRSRRRRDRGAPGPLCVPGAAVRGGGRTGGVLRGQYPTPGLRRSAAPVMAAIAPGVMPASRVKKREK